MNLSILIVDDEIDACIRLKHLLLACSHDHKLKINYTTSTENADNFLQHNHVDVVFSDIEMPLESGFEFIERVSKSLSFQIVFVTAYNEYAIKAIKMNALDYLLKPVDEEELIKTMDKIIQIAKNEEDFKNLAKQYSKTEFNKQDFNTLTIRNKTETFFLDIDNIVYLEGAGPYTFFFYQENDKTIKITSSHSLAYYQDLIPKQNFFRCHKSYIVNIKQILSIHFKDNYVIILKNKDNILLSRRNYNPLITMLRGKN